ncbi:gpi-anchored cell wall organization protein ecm33 [Diplodia corticola]|uniref:Gpi-anchored cell wall organization protein ecm33 n=1 Tax=Diplodia corticola TaxID=236234 RepID=A0A1J9RLG6_9PEZI|nr:gpi-anchored cell wall organization protein ecm33 [Diplodia corticola]OJD33419.1 gpi-anchored cell wall organization protein ecm33 [Diplodia corticola]
MSSFRALSVARLTVALMIWFSSSYAVAQSCSASMLTIRGPADTTAFALCPTFTGNIQISPEATGNISLDGLKRLNGHVTASDNGGLTGLSADLLEQIDDYMYLQRLPQLSTLFFPRLRSVGNQLRLEHLPELSELGFDATITECPSFSVTDTALTSISGIDPAGITDGFNITSNKRLEVITMTLNSTRLTTGGTVTVADNSPELSVAFPNLVSAQNLELSNISSILLPSLVESEEIAVRSSTIGNFTAPKLTNVGNGTFGLWFEACHDLIDIEVASLVNTGGFIVLDSEQVRNLTLPRLRTNVYGFRLAGDLEVLSIPAIQSISGNFFLNTSSSDFDCSPFRALKEAGKITGSFDCIAASNSTTVASTSPLANNLSAAQKAGVGVGVGGAVLLCLVLILSFVLRRKQRQRPDRRRAPQPLKSNHKDPAELGDGGEKKELPSECRIHEMASSPAEALNELETPSKAHELQADRQIVEVPGD